MAVWLTLGTSLPGVGPGDSALRIWMVLAFTEGMMAIIITSTPIPPIQCVNERQNNMPRGRDSTSLRMEAPVVVNPEMDSNSASSTRGMAPLSRKGSAPKADSRIQPSATMANPSRA